MNTARDIAREEILLDGLVDLVSLSAVNWKVRQQLPLASLSEIQNETLEVVRFLIEEGLFELGRRSGEDDGFVAWDEPPDVSMQRVYDAYVTHHDDELGWAYRFWLKLTPKGEQLVLSTEKGRHVAQAVEEELREIRAFRDGGRD